MSMPTHIAQLFKKTVLSEIHIPKGKTEVATIRAIVPEGKVPDPENFGKTKNHLCLGVELKIAGEPYRLLLPLNITNAKRLGQLFGGELKGWEGRRIAIYRDPNIRFGKKITGGFVVRPVSDE